MANRRFEMYQYRQVLVRMRQGDSNREIASSRLMGRKKASALRSLAEAEGWLDGPLPDDETLAERFGGPVPRLSSASLVEPFREDVTKWRSEGIQGTTIHRVLKEVHRFEGSYSSVQRFLQKLGDREPAATVILDFAPGDTAQVDFGRGPQVPGPSGEPESTWVFVMTLAWSRHQYAELVLDQKVTTWLGCHRRAFEFFGGVPSRVRIDNPKCAITRACYHEPGVQRAYGELAEGYGFKIDPCPPRDPKKKGRVESGVKYLKRSFMPLRRFRDLADSNHQLQEWVLGEAGNRIHGTTQERPLVRFTQTERPLLRGLPDIAPEPAEWVRVKVHTDGHVRHEKCRYSVPYRLIGSRLWLKATATMVGLFESCSLVASHSRLTRPGERSTVDDHLPPGALAFKRQDPHWCREQADQIGPCCRALIGELFRDRILDNLRAAQGVIRLGKSYGPQRLEAACERALAFGTPRYRSVKTILEKGLDAVADQEASWDRLASVYTGGGRFTRDTRTLLVN